MNKKKFFRFNVVYLFFIFLFLTLAFKIIYLQIYRHDFFDNLARRQHYGFFQIQGKRGRVFDRNRQVLARSLNFYSVFADPFFIEDARQSAKILAAKLDACPQRLLSQLQRKNRRFVWLKRKVDWQKKQEIEKLNLTGIGFIQENQRFYPEGSLLLPVLGLVDIDNNGIEGLELYYDHYLRGKESRARIIRDASSQKLILTPSLVQPQKGADLTLTIDVRIQYWAEKYLKEQVREFKASSASAVVMNALNGEIIALANYGNGFDRAKNLPFPRNEAVTDVFEPGSVFKVVTLAAAIAEGVYFETIYCENGAMPIPGTTLRDWRPYGNLSFEEVFYRSSNIGVAKIAKEVGPEKLSNYIKLFGFGQKTGIDFPGEVRGIFRPWQNWSRTSAYIIPIGQEIGVNLLQLARASAVFVNGGNLVKPHLAKRICYHDHCLDFEFKPKNILEKEVADKAKEIMVGIVEEGTGLRAAISGRKIGGKTGTAQKFDLKLGRYSPSKYRANFIGFISGISSPVVIVITVDEPKVSHFGGVVAAPLFRKIAEKVIAYSLE